MGKPLAQGEAEAKKSATVCRYFAEHAEAFARRLRSGAVGINRAVVSDPRLPFGGIGDSGYGRELSRAGIFEFVNVRAAMWG